MLNLKTILISSVNKFFVKFFSFFLSIYFLINSLDNYATIVLFFVMSAYAYEVINLSLSKTFNIFYFKYEKKVFETFVSLTIYVSLLIFSIFFLIFSVLGNHVSSEKFFLEYFFSISVLILGFSISIDDIIDRYCFIRFQHTQIYLYGILKIIVILLFTITYIFFYSENEIKYFLLFYSFLVLILVLFKFLYFLQKLSFDIINCFKILKIINLKIILNNTLLIFLVSLLILLQFSSNRIIISYFEGNIILANFYFHFQLIEVATLFFLITQEIFAPSLVNIAKLKNSKQIKVFQDKVLKILLIFPPIIFLYIIFISDFVIKIVNPEIKYNFQLLIILSLSLYFTFLFLTFYQYLIILDKRKLLLKTLILCVTINLFLSLILINFFSILGVAFANFASNFLLFLIINKSINFFTFKKEIFFFMYFCVLRIVFLFFLFYMMNYLDFTNSAYLKILIYSINLVIFLIIYDFFIPIKYRMIYVFQDTLKFIVRIKNIDN